MVNDEAQGTHLPLNCFGYMRPYEIHISVVHSYRKSEDRLPEIVPQKEIVGLIDQARDLSLFLWSERGQMKLANDVKEGQSVSWGLVEVNVEVMLIDEIVDELVLSCSSCQVDNCEFVLNRFVHEGGELVEES